MKTILLKLILYYLIIINVFKQVIPKVIVNNKLIEKSNYLERSIDYIKEEEITTIHKDYSNKIISFTIAIEQNNIKYLTDLLDQVSDPNSNLYGISSFFNNHIFIIILILIILY
jgi:hypothetical protein